MGKLAAYLLVVMGLVLIGCSSGPTEEESTSSIEAQLALAKAETAEAAPTDTATPVPSVTPRPTDTPAPTDTPIPTNIPAPIQSTETSTPTSETSPETTAEFEVTFDGKDCTVDGPAELPAGNHIFNFIDRSDVGGEVYLIYLQEGKTFQDNLDLQNEPGHWYAKPAWASYDLLLSTESQESDSARVDTSTWKLHRVGEHTILCYVASGPSLWFAAPLMIVESPSE